MSYYNTVNALANDAEQLEQTYQNALDAGEAEAFKQAIDASHTATPDNLLFAAWFYRLRETAVQAKSFVIAWAWLIPLAIVNGLLFWWLATDDRFVIKMVHAPLGVTYDFMPALLLFAAPLAATFILIYFTLMSRKSWRLTALISLGLIASAAYVYWTYPQLGTRPFQEQYLMLKVVHLPLLAWAGIGLFLLHDHPDPTSRFAFLIKSLEVFVMGGLMAIAGGLFVGITVGLFAALNIEFSELVLRLFIAGGAGLVPVVATAVIYNPALPPAKQSFAEGLSKLVALLMRIMLPLTLLVLLVYLAFIPFNFWEPFDNRDVLIIYNVMLFAVIVLLVGATPVTLNELSPQLANWLQRGILAVAALAFVISLYALAAILYRTAFDRLTPNRLTFIGWNVINIGLLFLLLLWQVRAKPGEWLLGLFRAYRVGTAVYALWILLMTLALPWLFGIDQTKIESLPQAVQNIVYERADPILLKCSESPHIYLLEDGEKRWIDTMETFDARGYVWQDVQFVSCDVLDQVPAGISIPETAGLPPS